MRILNLLAAIVALVVTVSSPAWAQTRIDDPVAFVTALYGRMNKASNNHPYAPPEDIYTPRLAALFALDRKEAGGEVGRMEFDIWSNAQDWQLSGVKVTALPVDGVATRRIVVARFRNFAKPQELHFYFEKFAAGWKLDDARSFTAGQPWVLSLLLKYGWEGTP